MKNEINNMNSILTQIFISLFISFIVLLLYHFIMQRKWTNKREVDSRLFELESAVRRLSNNLPTANNSGSDLSKNKDILMVKDGKKKDKKKHDRNPNKRDNSNHVSQLEDNNLNDAEDNTSEVMQLRENPSVAEPQKPGSIEVKYTNLTISDGKLVEASIGQTAYYRSWLQKGKILFEFNGERQRMKKAIYNRTAILDPFCLKDASSILPEEANYLETIHPGELDSDYNIIKKATIKYLR